MISPNDGNFIADALISNQSFAVVSGSATITTGSGSEALGGIFLDDDPTEDDLGFRTETSALSATSGDTISISGTVTLNVDLNQLIEGNYLSETTGTTGGFFLTDALQLNISEGAATTPEPSALIGLFAVGGLGLLSRKKKQK
ncbi:MAG: PEP-CTERM sorting domain-containing protein [Microcystaceae cyanobacterium]